VLFTFSALVRREPFWMGLSSPGVGETGVGVLEGVLSGWKPFMAKEGSSSIRRLDLRRLCLGFAGDMVISILKWKYCL
jgi:hypothetical protein